MVLSVRNLSWRALWAAAGDIAAWAKAEIVRPGIAASLLLHLLMLLLFVRWTQDLREQQPQSSLRTIPVDLVLLSEYTASPPERQTARVPQQARTAVLAQPRIRAPAPTPAPLEGVAPRKTQEPPDALDEKLTALAQMKLPDTTTGAAASAGLSDLSATSKDARPGREATYSVSDYVRAQAERRWNLNIGALPEQNFTVAIRVLMKRDGTILNATVVDAARAKSDAVYNSVARSARNAVLLSSPIALPPGRYGDTMDMILNMNPRDTLR